MTGPLEMGRLISETLANEMQKVPNKTRMRVGTAGWSITASCRTEFPDSGSVLEKYATRFNAVEINSSFYRAHRTSTYEKWASQVPEDFSFSAKLPRHITHRLGLQHIDEPLDQFAEQVRGLGNKLGCVLVQLPPSFEFFKANIISAFAQLKRAFDCQIVCEPRNVTWFTNEVDKFLNDNGVTRAAVDPALCQEASVPGGMMETCYYRLHGTPDMYYSDYSVDRLQHYAHSILYQKDNSEVWFIFDNTARGRATPNALLIQRLLTF